MELYFEGNELNFLVVTIMLYVAGLLRKSFLIFFFQLYNTM